MQRKLVVLVSLVLLAFLGLSIRIYAISRDNGSEYTRTVLSQQSYDSRVIDFKRGSIIDAKGTVLADSELVYDVIVDAKQMLSKDYYLEPSLHALEELGVDAAAVRKYIADNPSSQYYVVRKNLPYKDKTAYDERLRVGREQEDANGTPVKDRIYSNIKGIWFDANYIRNYPNGSLACDVIGFTNGSNEGQMGLEEYYNDTLNGTPGREYGYLDEMSNLERTTIDAVDGYNLITTIDANIQSIIEKYLKQFNETHANEVHTGNGANNVGCIVMNVKTGEILGMGSYPNFDLNDPYNINAVTGMPKLNDKDAPSGEFMTQEDVNALSKEDQTRYLNALWRNFCISDIYEPGSVAKPFTVAAALESGSITGNEHYNCEGHLDVADWPIYCHNRYGDGVISVSQSIEMSCNVALMEIAFAAGKENFCKFQDIFNFGLKTNIDLAGEVRTDTVVIRSDKMNIADLATNSFGQNFNVTMIQMAAGFASLINGGNYYEPHMVNKITSASGTTVRNIEPRVLKKTVSPQTSAKIREYCHQVVVGENGTGKTARPAGYMIGGKTGTAETLPRKNNEYVVSFMGFTPWDDPEILIYVVVDRPNVPIQADAKFATGIVRNVLTEVLPYLGQPMTESLSESEMEELRELEESNAYAIGANGAPAAAEEEAADPEAGEGTAAEGIPEGTEGFVTAGEGQEEEEVKEPVWKSFEIDPETGYLIDPSNGHHIDPDTGFDYDGTFEESAVTPIP